MKLSLHYHTRQDEQHHIPPPPPHSYKSLDETLMKEKIQSLGKEIRTYKAQILNFSRKKTRRGGGVRGRLPPIRLPLYQASSISKKKKKGTSKYTGKVWKLTLP